MKQPKTEKLSVSPLRTAEVFWGRWITELSFHPGVDDPYTVAADLVVTVHGINTGYAQEVVGEALDRVLNQAIVDQQKTQEEV